MFVQTINSKYKTLEKTATYFSGYFPNTKPVQMPRMVLHLKYRAVILMCQELKGTSSFFSFVSNLKRDSKINIQYNTPTSTALCRRCEVRF